MERRARGRSGLVSSGDGDGDELLEVRKGVGGSVMEMVWQVRRVGDTTMSSW
jgi:hypothetical protein